MPVKTSYAPWSEGARDLLHKRYPGSTPDPEKFFGTIAHNVAPGGSAWEERYRNLLSSRQFLATTATLGHRYEGKEGPSAGCMVLPLPQRHVEVLSQTIPEAAKALEQGMGIGCSLSSQPPRLTTDRCTGRAHSGPLEVITSIASATKTMAIYGGLKRAAFMASLPWQHPDIFSFIRFKEQHRIAEVNVSVAIDDAFTLALKKGALLPLKWSEGGEEKLLTRAHLDSMQVMAMRRSVDGPDLSIQEGTDAVYSRAAQRIVGKLEGDVVTINPSTLLDLISESIHRCGDPGLLHLGVINRDNPTHPEAAKSPQAQGVGIIETTTPCGEQPLLPYEVCHLGSLNLNAFYTNGQFDEEAFREAAKTAVRFLDDAIDKGTVPVEQAERSKATRKIGIGIMGLADVLAQLEIPYDSDEALSFADRVGKALREATLEASQALAREKGAFPAWEHSRAAREGKPPQRNATLTTIAPTGYISILADCSSALEPYYLLAFVRQAAGLRIMRCAPLEQKLKSLHFSLEDWIRCTQKKDPSYQFDGTLRGLCDTPTEEPQLNARLCKLKAVFKTAGELSPEAHLAMMATLQKHIDNGVSKTINLPQNTNLTTIRHILERYLELGLKGITLFRDKCLEEAQALTEVPSCPSCNTSVYMEKNDCGSLTCSPQKGGCGYGVCSL